MNCLLAIVITAVLFGAPLSAQGSVRVSYKGRHQYTAERINHDIIGPKQGNDAAVENALNGNDPPDPNAPGYQEVDPDAPDFPEGHQFVVMPKEQEARSSNVAETMDGVTSIRQEVLDEPERLAIVLAHEADHAAHGDHGALDDCMHAGTVMDTAIDIREVITKHPEGSAERVAACLRWYGRFKKNVDEAEEYRDKCNADYGTPSRADGSSMPPTPTSPYVF